MNIFGTTGQQRRAWLDSQGQNALDMIQYYAGPGVNVNALATIADMFNPVADIQRAGTAFQGATAPGVEPWDRLGYLGAAATDMASVLAPVAGAAYADDAARGLTEGLANWTMPADDLAARFVADEDGAFAGIRALTADRDALARAQAMTEAGASRDDIWRETGWFRGVDGQWRFEIDDSGMQLAGRSARVMEGPAGGRDFDYFERTIDHAPLHAAYPNMPNVEMAKVDGTPSGTYNLRESGLDNIQVEARTPRQAKEILAHEAQHAIQQREGFALGSSPLEWSGTSRDAVMAVDAEAKRIFAEFPKVRPLDWLDLPEASRAEFRRRAINSLYTRSAGEVEADNVIRRLDMTPDQRRATPPWLTQDVPDDQQIIRGILQKYSVE